MQNFTPSKRKNHKSHNELAVTRWDDINWPKVEKQVSKLRTQIFLAKLQGDFKRLRSLQTIALNSKSNLLYSIRKVTSLNRGRKTAGPDKQVYLTPDKRLALFKELCEINTSQWQPAPVRRIEIPRPGKSPRPLGIPNITDRVIQLVVKNALEPEWEAVFENGSYGFRPGRGAHDAMMRIWRVLSSKKRLWILDADIKGCFNNIAHEPLLHSLEGFPAQDLIRRWLKAGYFMGKVFSETPVGTPQGGIISPLLANIALHGMETALGVKYHTHGYIRTECPFIPARYADDFVVLCRTEEEANRAKEILSKWLAARGMEFAPDKTTIRQATDGFDFLGWNFRLFPKRKGEAWLRSKADLVTLVRPSAKSVKALQTKLSEIWRNSVGKAGWVAITQLNPILTGWANYHKYSNASEAFRDIDHFQYLQSIRYARRKHPTKSWSWIRQRYFMRKETPKMTKTGRFSQSVSNWTFFDESYSLVQLRTVSLENYVSIGYGKNSLNPADNEYFLERKFQQFRKKGSFKLALYDKQGGLCPVCGKDLVSGDWDEPLHVHHLIPRKVGGKDNITNLMLLHEECHYSAHRNELEKDK